MTQVISAFDQPSYARKLVNAGIGGIQSGYREFDPALASSLVANSAETSLKLALTGACLGIVPAMVLARRSRTATSILFGTLGSVLGFAIGFSWKTRPLTSKLAHSALREVRRVKDEHWLETNPIDYA
jgi:DNA-binding transcriptional LysR family regulator